jgi:3-methyl-2-oxobutanoate hydroxymethyltransferase
VRPRVARARVTAASPVPIIGIGAGPDVDAQVLVWHDLLGLSAAPHPRFVRAYADVRTVIADAVTAFRDDVRAGTFPTAAESYGDGTSPARHS